MLLDIEELNRRAAGARARADEAQLRRGGGGRRPLPAAAQRRRARSRRRAARRRARGRCRSRTPRPGASRCPGRETTAFLLLRLAAPALGDVVELRYDRILDAVVAGDVDAGLIIHESRFTYAEHGLVAVADLGEWWEGETGLPVPLAGIFARSDLEPEVVDAAEAAIRASVEYAFAHPGGEPRLRPLALAGDVRRGLRGAHRALRERAQRRHRRRGARRDRPAARSGRCRCLDSRGVSRGRRSSPPSARRSAATAARSRASARTISPRS